MCLAILVALFSIVGLGGADGAEAATRSGKFQYTDQWSGTPSGLLAAPADTAVADNGDVYVLDSGNNRVQVFDENGTYKFQFGKFGNSLGQFRAPLGIKIYGNTVLVADSGNNRIQTLSLGGEPISSFGSQGSGNGQLQDPRDVTRLANGLVYVADSGNNRISVWQNGSYIGAFGSGGSGNTQFSVPFGVDGVSRFDDQICDGGGFVTRLYVADTQNSRIVRYETSSCLTIGQATPGYSGQWSVGGYVYKAKLKDRSDYSSDIYAAGTGLNRVTRYTSAGSLVANWGTAGDGDGQFRGPQGLGINVTNGRVFVADAQNNRVQRFSAGGTFETKWGITQNGAGEFSSPTDVAKDSAGNIYAVDRNNSRIEKFNSSGRFLMSFGGAGTGNGQLSTPYGLAISASDQIYVVDRGNNRVQIFDTSGNYVNKWGTSGSAAGQFSAPTDIALVNNNIYVVDTGNNRVQGFTAPGVYGLHWGTQGTGNGQFVNPTGIASGEGYLYVSDAGGIQKFNGLGTFVSRFAETGLSGLSWNSEILIASSQQNGQLVAFNSSGASGMTRRAAFCSNGSGSAQLANPVGNWVQPGTPYWDNIDGYTFRILVADSGNNRITQTEVNQSTCSQTGALGNSDFYAPTATAEMPNGDVWMADAKNNRVVRFTEDGQAVSRFGFGAGSDGFNSDVRGVGVGSDGSLFAADGVTLRRFSAAGAVINSVPRTLTQDIAVGTSDQVYAVVGSQVIRYSSTLVQQGTFGGAGSGNGQLTSPAGVGTAPNGDVYVADLGNNRIERFNAGGTYLSQFAVTSPSDVAVGDDGRVYVASAATDTVKVYENASGLLTEQWGSVGDDPGQFANPSGVTVTSNDRVYVADRDNNRIQLFDWLASRTQYSDQATDYAGNQVAVPNQADTTVEGGF